MISLSDIHASSADGLTDGRALRARIVELEARARADAMRLARLGKVVERYDVLTRRLQLQYEVSEILGKAASVELALPAVLGAIGRIKLWDVATIWRREGDEWVRSYEWRRPLADSAFMLTACPQADPGCEQRMLLDRAANEGRLVWVDDFSAKADSTQVSMENSVKCGTALAFPLMSEGAVYGVVQLARQDAGGVSAASLGLIDALRKDIDRFIAAKSQEARLKQERSRLETSLRLTATAVDQAAEAVVILDAEGRVVSVNPAFSRITGYAGDLVVGQMLDELLYKPASRHSERFDRRVRNEVISSGHWEGEAWARRQDGQVIPTLLSVSMIRDEHGEAVNYVCVFNDISSRKLYEEHLKVLALHDGLTGLPNRSMLVEHLGRTLSEAQQDGRHVAVLFADLDRFKAVNDQFGHDVGDRVLTEVAARLKSCVGNTDLVARLGGDEFVIVLSEQPSRCDAKLVAEKILAAIARPYLVGEHQVQVGVSVGITLYPEDARKAELLLKLADEALYRVKRGGRNGYRFGTVAKAECREQE